MPSESNYGVHHNRKLGIGHPHFYDLRSATASDFVPTIPMWPGWFAPTFLFSCRLAFDSPPLSLAAALLLASGLISVSRNQGGLAGSQASLVLRVKGQ